MGYWERLQEHQNKDKNPWPERIVIALLGLLIIGVLSLSQFAQAHEPPKEIHGIYWSDGDSGWINGRKHGFAFRLNDIDAPETTKGHWVTRNGKRRWRGARCEYERELGYKAKAFSVDATSDLTRIYVSHYDGHDGHKRHIIDLAVDGKDLGEMGIKAGHYRSWRHKGSKALEARPNWCLASG